MDPIVSNKVKSSNSFSHLSKEERCCLNCKKINCKTRCSQCQRVYFCDRNCQIRSWDDHRAKCFPTDEKASAAPRISSPSSSDGQQTSKEISSGEKIVDSHTDTSIAIDYQADSKTTISWGSVSVREFFRYPGGSSGVPFEGTWALGLGNLKCEYDAGTIDIFEFHRAQDINRRTQKLTDKERKLANGETRQFDYRRGKNNPLFRRLEERDRKTIMVGLEKCGSSTKRPTRSSKGKKPLQEHDNGECEAISGMTLHEVKKMAMSQLDELIDLRESRERVGCVCGEELTNAPKSSVKQLKAILAKYGEGRLSGKESKKELLCSIRNVTSESYFCNENSEICECAKNGIPCHENVCSEACILKCANPEIGLAYSTDAIQAYRAKYATCDSTSNTVKI